MKLSIPLIFFVLSLFIQKIILAHDKCDCECIPNDCKYVQATNLGGGNLNVRQGPGTTYKVLGVISEGHVLDSRAAVSNSWHPVKYNGQDAFISATYGKCLANKPEIKKYIWTVPSSTRVCQSYGNQIDYQSCGFHTGIDICASQGSDIVAMASGTVVHVGPLWLNGPGIGRGPYSIVIDHGDSMYSTYGHNSKTIVKNGDKITAGQKIAEIGSLGYSSGPHLHLEVLENTKWTGNWKNPFLDDCDTTTKNLTLSQKLARAKYKNPLNYAKP